MDQDLSSLAAAAIVRPGAVVWKSQDFGESQGDYRLRNRSSIIPELYRKVAKVAGHDCDRLSEKSALLDYLKNRLNHPGYLAKLPIGSMEEEKAFINDVEFIHKLERWLSGFKENKDPKAYTWVKLGGDNPWSYAVYHPSQDNKDWMSARDKECREILASTHSRDSAEQKQSSAPQPSHDAPAPSTLDVPRGEAEKTEAKQPEVSQVINKGSGTVHFHPGSKSEQVATQIIIQYADTVLVPESSPKPQSEGGRTTEPAFSLSDDSKQLLKVRLFYCAEQLKALMKEYGVKELKVFGLLIDDCSMYSSAEINLLICESTLRNPFLMSQKIASFEKAVGDLLSVRVHVDTTITLPNRFGDQKSFKGDPSWAIEEIMKESKSIEKIFEEGRKQQEVYSHIRTLVSDSKLNQMSSFSPLSFSKFKELERNQQIAILSLAKLYWEYNFGETVGGRLTLEQKVFQVLSSSVKEILKESKNFFPPFLVANKSGETLEIMEYLLTLDRSSVLAMKDSSGNVLLHLAVRNRYVAMARLLRRCSASMTDKDRDGRTVFDCAAEVFFGNLHVEEYKAFVQDLALYPECPIDFKKRVPGYEDLLSKESNPNSFWTKKKIIGGASVAVAGAGIVTLLTTTETCNIM